MPGRLAIRALLAPKGPVGAARPSDRQSSIRRIGRPSKGSPPLQPELVVPPALVPPTPALTSAAADDPVDPGPRRQRIEGIVVEICREPPARGALGVAWVATVPGSASLLDVRGLVLWPGTSIGGARSRPGDGLTVGARVRAWAREEEYWSFPPAYDATRIEIAGVDD